VVIFFVISACFLTVDVCSVASTGAIRLLQRLVSDVVFSLLSQNSAHSLNFCLQPWTALCIIMAAVRFWHRVGLLTLCSIRFMTTVCDYNSVVTVVPFIVMFPPSLEWCQRQSVFGLSVPLV